MADTMAGKTRSGSLDRAFEKAWLRAGAGIFLVLAGMLALLRRWKLARASAKFAAACLVEWRDARLSAQVARALAASGRRSDP